MLNDSSKPPFVQVEHAPGGVFDPTAPPKKRLALRRPKTSQPKQWGPVFAIVYALFLYFATQIVGGIVLAVVLRSLGWDPGRIEDWLTSATFAQFLFIFLVELMTIMGVFWYVRRRGFRLADIGWNRFKLQYVTRALVGFGVYFVLLIVVLSLASTVSSHVNLDQKQELGFDSVTTNLDLLLTGVSLIIFAPLAEEILFRGFLLKGLRSRLSWLPAVLLTSLVFAIGHLQIGSGKPLLWAAAVDTFVLSLVLCYVRIKSDSLWPGILIHATKNALAFAALFVFAN